MIDLTTIQANPIPPSIIQLQSANLSLKEKNKVLCNVLIIGGILLSIYVADKIITYIKDEKRINKNQP